MGSLVHLGLGHLEIDWGQNYSFQDHSKLFLPTDVRPIPYYYADGIVIMKEGAARPLESVRHRLDLLGYSICRLEDLYEEYLGAIPGHYADVSVSFDELYAALVTADVSRIELAEDREYYDIGKYVADFLFQQPELRKARDLSAKVTGEAAEIIEQIDPYIVLRILAENPGNRLLDVEWRFADVVEGGYVSRDEMLQPLSEDARILVVTEGSSDTFVIRRAIHFLRPDIADFFTFVDMEDNYPFTGAGNLFRFCQGLSTIGLQNKCLVVLDNDAVGCATLSRIKALKLPANMHVVTLPDLEDFRRFPTVGPSGSQEADINGTAVAIECSLDLTYKQKAPPVARWSSYDRATGHYQGELENKESYLRLFKSVPSNASDYDFSKLQKLVDYLIKEWVNRDT